LVGVAGSGKHVCTLVGVGGTLVGEPLSGWLLGCAAWMACDVDRGRVGCSLT
jgi:hypothetical protein